MKTRDVRICTAGSIALALALAPSRAEAAACCGDEGSLGQRLGRFERAAAAESSEVVERFGGFDGQGVYHPLGAGEYDHEFRFDLSWVVRASSRLEVGGDLPFVLDARSFGGTSDVGGGVGDANAFARFEVAPVEDVTLWPALFTTVSVTIPTGRPTELASGLGADITGQGVPGITLGVSLTKTYASRWFVDTAGSVGFFLPSEAGGFDSARAPRLRGELVTGPTFSIAAERGLEFGAGVAYEFEPPAVVRGARAPTGVSRLTLLASGAIDVSRRASVLASIESALSASHTGSNDVATFAFTLGARYAFGLFD